ncbi:MAG: hypothetical protein N2691_03865 [Patescibacteria group bacterium]|nr:hypothetical protein [Patescibacteria group bacterium]
MSNVGKTTMAKKIEEELGFTRYSVDDMIEERLSDILLKNGYRSISDVARWMGHPYHSQYPKASKTYIDAERKCMQAIFKEIRARRNEGKNIVIDTTGSVIYTGTTILNTMRHLSKVLYLESTAEEIQLLMQRFVTNPKPLIWGDCYRREAHEDPYEALKLSYPDLLNSRDQQYRKIAHVVVPFKTIRNPAFTASSLVEYSA